ncbi:hypothetical protein IFR05_014440 [Cadophora sp. M221]|nr:hypothetical protein IFR05_014440 [Cadophora sp. M221]
MAPRSIKALEARRNQNRIAQRKFRERKAAQFNEMHERLKATDKELFRLQDIIFQVRTITEDSTIALLCQEAFSQAIEFGETPPKHDRYASSTWPNSFLGATNAEESTIIGALKDSNQTIGTLGTSPIDKSLAIQPFTTNWSNPFFNNYSELPMYGNDWNGYFNASVLDFNSQLVCYEPEAPFAACTDLFASLSYDMSWNNTSGVIKSYFSLACN